MPDQARRTKLVTRAQDFMNKHTFASHDDCVAALVKEFESFQATIDVRDATINALEADREMLIQELARLLKQLGREDLAT